MALYTAETQALPKVNPSEYKRSNIGTAPYDVNIAGVHIVIGFSDKMPLVNCTRKDFE